MNSPFPQNYVAYRESDVRKKSDIKEIEVFSPRNTIIFYSVK